MFVQKIKIQHSPPHATTEINLEDFSFSERKQIVENLDAHLTKPLNDYFNQILNLNIPNYIHAKCSHCPHTISHDLNIVNMYFFIKNILFDFNYIEILADIANISANLHLSGEFLLGTTPMERLNYKSFIKRMKIAFRHPITIMTPPNRFYLKILNLVSPTKLYFALIFDSVNKITIYDFCKVGCNFKKFSIT